MIDIITEELGNIDVLINNAAPSHQLRISGEKSLEETLRAEVRCQFDGSLKSSFLCTKAVIPNMRAAKYGRIVSVLSNLVFDPEVAYHGYTAAKASLLGFSRSLAREFGTDGVTINGCPRIDSRHRYDFIGRCV